MTGFAFAYAVVHGLWRSATEKSGCAVLGKDEISVSRRFAISQRFYFEFKKMFER